MTDQVPPFVGSPRELARRVRLSAAHSWAGHHYRWHDGMLIDCADPSCRNACRVFRAVDAIPPYMLDEGDAA